MAKVLDDMGEILRKDLQREDVIAFLDYYFKVSNIEIESRARETKFVKDTWLAVYSEYISHCHKMTLKPVTYSYFTIIR